MIGAGVVGCSIAFHLARAGARVRVFDKGPICAGMTSRSGALVRMHYTFAPEADLAWKSHAYFRNWREMVGGECGFVRTGFTVFVSDANAAKLRHNVATLKSLGIDTELMTPSEYSRLELATDLNDVGLIAYEPQSGYADPVATTKALADAAHRHGAGFTLDTRIAKLATRGGRVAGIVDEHGRTYESDAVCVAAGPWTDALLGRVAPIIGIRAERAQIAFFQRPPSLKHSAIIDTIAGLYFRPHGDDLTLAGLGEWGKEPSADPDRFNELNDEDFISAARQRLARRIPAFAEASYVRGHAGIYDVSPDARAVIGPVPGVEHLFVAAGFSGTGFKTAPAVGAAMSELILTGVSQTADLAPFVFERILEGRLIESPTEYSMGAGFGHKI